MKRFLQNLKNNFNVDWKEFWIGMLVYLSFWTLLAIAFLVTKTWQFDIVLVYYYVGGFLVSVIFNLLNPNNQKK